MAVVAALLFFVSILLHESGHALQARREGIEIDGITLWLLAGLDLALAGAMRTDVRNSTATARVGVRVTAAARPSGPRRLAHLGETDDVREDAAGGEARPCW
jgi:Zn-dependent protease